MRILVIEDDSKIARTIKHSLEMEGYEVAHSASGGDGYILASEGDFGVLVVDRMLPVMDGLKLVEKLRANGKQTPVLFLSALGSVDDRVTGLKAGGDDYLTKPFATSELIARVEALARRQANEPSKSELTLGDLKIDLMRREVSREGQMIDLQPREYRLLEYLMRHHDQVVTRTMLLQNVWDYHFDPQTNIIDVHVSRLRAKIDKPFNQALLKTVRGAGYMLTND